MKLVFRVGNIRIVFHWVIETSRLFRIAFFGARFVIFSCFFIFLLLKHELLELFLYQVYLNGKH